MHKIAVLAMDDVVPLDLGIAYQIFGFALRADGAALYDVKVCATRRSVMAGGFRLQAPFGLAVLADADTIIVPGSEYPLREVPKSVIDALRGAYERGARVASICTGAFVLAASGLLDGRRATTHWRVARELSARYPDVAVDPDVLFVDEGRVITSAGASSGLDTCLHIVGRDYGQSVAAEAARRAVAPLHRDGGQAQFIRHEHPGSAASLVSLLGWLSDNLRANHTVNSLAAKAGMSPRTFARRFQEQVGTSPLHWLVIARLDRARELLEDRGRTIEEIAFLSGFGSAITFRARFRRAIGITPTEYRRRFSGG